MPTHIDNDGKITITEPRSKPPERPQPPPGWQYRYEVGTDTIERVGEELHAAYVSINDRGNVFVGYPIAEAKIRRPVRRDQEATVIRADLAEAIAWLVTVNATKRGGT